MQFLHSSKVFKHSLLAVLTLLLSIYMGLLWHYGDEAHLGISGLFILALGMMLYESPKPLKLFPTKLGLFLGAFGVAIALSISAFLLHQQSTYQGSTLHSPLLVSLLRLLPALIGLSLAVLAKGLPGIRYFWREEGLLLAVGLPGVLALFVADISPLTAVFSAKLLAIGGFDIVQEGVTLSLPGGSVIVYYGCSGIESICYLLSLSVLFLIMFPVSGFKRFLAPLVGIVLAFVINSFRVALMAILWAKNDVERFDYWHMGEGSMLFGLAAVIAFSVFYVVVLQSLEKRSTLAASS
ncbi:cyanoexosortase A [Oscillatoria sp. CS-180]|uniref:cyanoexosortase A n=1 Tax=Oscillatoria sp. CS-180 TaxID=3021720 RepID=UPI00232A8803|nr:cyanoexosortase A [Oscillatoria sp. CS-180]MDB9524741.1 cyanoexosortase A [Oscillatoria sp. CS-180]